METRYVNSIQDRQAFGHELWLTSSLGDRITFDKELMFREDVKNLDGNLLTGQEAMWQRGIISGLLICQ